MNQRFRKNVEIIQIVVSLFIVIIVGIDMIGQPARLVTILTLFAGAVGIGVSIGVYAERKRIEHQNEIAKNKKDTAA